MVTARGVASNHDPASGARRLDTSTPTRCVREVEIIDYVSDLNGRAAPFGRAASLMLNANSLMSCVSISRDIARVEGLT